MMQIFPSLISSDLLSLSSTIAQLNDHCHGYHLDVMDFHFVPNLTWGPQFVHAIMQATQLPVHVHLMVDEPAKWLEVLNMRADDCVVFHIESVSDVDQARQLLKAIRDKGCKSGIALSPKTAVETIAACLDMADQVLVMSVEPGFSGQAFMPEVLPKVQALKQQRDAQGLSFVIGMDGGISADTIERVCQAGVEHVAAASAIFGSDDPVAAIAHLAR